MLIFPSSIPLPAIPVIMIHDWKGPSIIEKILLTCWMFLYVSDLQDKQLCLISETNNCVVLVLQRNYPWISASRSCLIFQVYGLIFCKISPLPKDMGYRITWEVPVSCSTNDLRCAATLLNSLSAIQFRGKCVGALLRYSVDDTTGLFWCSDTHFL